MRILMCLLLPALLGAQTLRLDSIIQLSTFDSSSTSILTRSYQYKEGRCIQIILSNQSPEFGISNRTRLVYNGSNLLSNRMLDIQDSSGMEWIPADSIAYRYNEFNELILTRICSREPVSETLNCLRRIIRSPTAEVDSTIEQVYNRLIRQWTPFEAEVGYKDADGRDTVVYKLQFNDFLQKWDTITVVHNIYKLGLLQDREQFLYEGEGEFFKFSKSRFGYKNGSIVQQIDSFYSVMNGGYEAVRDTRWTRDSMGGIRSRYTYDVRGDFLLDSTVFHYDYGISRPNLLYFDELELSEPFLHHKLIGIDFYFSNGLSLDLIRTDRYVWSSISSTDQLIKGPFCRILPNPNMGHCLLVDEHETKVNEEILVVDSYGRVLGRFLVSKGRLDLTKLPAGIYHLSTLDHVKHWRLHKL